MTIRYPFGGRWTQTNESDRLGSLSSTRNVSFDRAGYARISPRSVALLADTGDVTGSEDSNLGWPVAFGRSNYGTFRVATTDSAFDFVIRPDAKTVSEDQTGGNPTCTTNSHGCWWQNRWYASQSTTVIYNDGSWSGSVITSLTAGKRHYMEVFRNRSTLCVTNGNVIKQYDTSHSGTTDLTLPSDYEATGLAYNNLRMGIITRLGSDSAGQNQSSVFFIWDGATTDATDGIEIGADYALGVVAYKSSWVILTSAGELLYWNGGGFDRIAAFPFYFDSKWLGDLVNHVCFGDMMHVDGDLIYINAGLGITPEGRNGEGTTTPSGVWCYDPQVGLYHRFSPSISMSYFHTVTAGNINTSTDTFTTAEFIPATGNPIRLTQSGGVVGVTEGRDYFIIRTSDTTFKLAQTEALAQAGTAIDITSAGGGTSYFWAFDLKDFGQTFGGYNDDTRRTGAVTAFNWSDYVTQDVMFGGEYYGPDLTEQITVCSTVPMLESRGQLTFSRKFADSVTGNARKGYVRFERLRESDAIVVKVRTRDVDGLPVVIPQKFDDAAGGTWTNDNVISSTADLSAALTAFTAGRELELDVMAGAGGGQASKVESTEYPAGTYTVTLADTLTGPVSSDKCYFSISAWETKATVTATSPENDNGYIECPIPSNSTYAEMKVELRGYWTTVVDADIQDVPAKS